MKYRLPIIVLTVVMALPLGGQSGPQLLPPAVEKELAARASDVTEVTLGKNMLDFASKVMKGKDNDEAATRQLIQGLEGIYVRSYEFDKEGQYSEEQLEQLRKHFEGAEWVSLVRERSRKSGESTDVMVKMINGQSHGMFVLTAEKRELTIVLILGKVNLSDLGKLKGLGGLDSLGVVEKETRTHERAKGGNAE